MPTAPRPPAGRAPPALLVLAFLAAMAPAPGAALLAPQSQDPTPAAAAPDTTPDGGTFKVLTYNVAGLPPGVSKSKPLRNMLQISLKLAAYDVVLVQEDFFFNGLLGFANDHAFRSDPQDASRVFSSTFLSMLLAFPDLDVDAIFALLDEDRITSDGLNRFSRFAFDVHERHRWAECHGVTSAANDCLATKGFTFARHELASGASVDVYNVHADAGRRPEDEQARRVQFAQLAEFIETRSAGRAVLVGGDTNLQSPVPADEETIQEFLSRLGLQVAARSLAQEDGVDRLFYRSGEVVELVPVARGEGEEFVDRGGSPLSDHPAVWVEFSWALRDPARR